MKSEPDETDVATILTRELLAGGTPRQVQLPDGGSLRIVRAETPGVAVIAVIEGLGNRDQKIVRFEESSVRPAIFPEDMPFLTGQSSMFTESRFGRYLDWENAAEPGMLAEIMLQSEADGWVVTRRMDNLPLPMLLTIIELQKAGRKRAISVGAGGIVLIESVE
jgi:hypothetical protein